MRTPSRAPSFGGKRPCHCAIVGAFVLFTHFSVLLQDRTIWTISTTPSVAMKSLSFLLIIALLSAASAFVPVARPTFSSSRAFLLPEQAKDLEAVAPLQYEYQQMLKEALGHHDQPNSTYNDHHPRNGPVAWCRRVLFNWTHKDATLRP